MCRRSVRHQNSSTFPWQTSPDGERSSLQRLRIVATNAGTTKFRDLTVQLVSDNRLRRGRWRHTHTLFRSLAAKRKIPQHSTGIPGDHRRWVSPHSPSPIHQEQVSNAGTINAVGISLRFIFSRLNLSIRIRIAKQARNSDAVFCRHQLTVMNKRRTEVTNWIESNQLNHLNKSMSFMDIDCVDMPIYSLPPAHNWHFVQNKLD